MHVSVSLITISWSALSLKLVVWAAFTEYDTVTGFQMLVL